MDALLARFGVQALNYAIRTSIALTSRYAIGQCGRLLKTIDDKKLRAEFKRLETQLDVRIQIISPAINLIDFKAGRGHASLEAARPLTKALQQDIAELGARLEELNTQQEAASAKSPSKAECFRVALLEIINEMTHLLARIDRDIPILQLAISTSGESLSSAMPSTISPSRLLQASAFLNIGDTQFACHPSRAVQIGPSFTLSLFMLFVGHASHTRSKSPPHETHGHGSRGTTCGTSQEEAPSAKPMWQEVLHKSRVRICRTPLSWSFQHPEGFRRDLPVGVEDVSQESMAHMATEFSYHLEIIEDLDDDRVHDIGDSAATSYDNIARAGVRDAIPIHQISKIFYADTGRILNIGSEDSSGNNPVLLVKRDVTALHPGAVNQRADLPSLGEAEVVRLESSDGTIGMQQEIDQQLHHDSQLSLLLDSQPSPAANTRFPTHLDPEWLAFEVYAASDDDTSSDSSVEATRDQPIKLLNARPSKTCMNDELVDQVKNISLTDADTRALSHNRAKEDVATTDKFVARSPFGGIVSSLSLMETLIRLTSLQEFQQASHLTIPDHILTFFLEDTSTTGQHGEERWRTRQEVKRRVGFDPFTDSPDR